MRRPASLLFALLAVAAAAAAGFAVPRARLADGEEAPPGREVFLRKNCQYCHSVLAVGIARGTSPPKQRGPDLSDIGLHRTEEELLVFLRRGSANARHHWKPFWGTNRDLTVLVDWLSGLRVEPAPEDPAGRRTPKARR